MAGICALPSPPSQGHDLLSRIHMGERALRHQQHEQSTQTWQITRLDIITSQL